MARFNSDDQISDHQIQQWLNERKELPTNWSKLICEERHFFAKGENGNIYRVILSLNPRRKSYFSVILIVYPLNSKEHCRLRRYESPHNEHTNPIENTSFTQKYHIHMATERYQGSTYKIDHYAEETNRFNDRHSAIQCLMNDANFQKQEVE